MHLGHCIKCGRATCLDKVPEDVADLLVLGSLLECLVETPEALGSQVPVQNDEGQLGVGGPRVEVVHLVSVEPGPAYTAGVGHKRWAATI